MGDHLALSVAGASNPSASAGGVARRDLETIAQGGVALLLASVFGNGLSYVFGIVLARLLGPAEFGVYALALSIFNAMVLVALLGMDTGVIKFIAAHLAEGRTHHARATSVQVGLIAMVSGLVVGIGLAVLAGPLSGAVYKMPRLDMVLWFFGAMLPLACVSTIFVAVLQAFQTIRPMIVIKYLWEPIGKLTLAGGLAWAGVGLAGVMAALVLTAAVSVVMSALAVIRMTGVRMLDVSRWRQDNLKGLLGYGLPLALSNAVAAFTVRSDILILGYWASAQEVGIYLAAFQTSAMLALVLGAFDTAVAPMIGGAWAQQNRVRLEHVYQTAGRLVFSVALPLALIMIIFAADVLGVFGLEFAAGAACLTVLVIGQLLNGVSGTASTVLLMSGRSRLVMTNSIIVGVILVAASALLIPVWGIWGAALATSVGLVAINITRVVQVWRLFGVQPFTWGLAKPLVAGSVAATLVLAMKTGVSPAYSPVLAGALIVLYVGVLALFSLEQDDRAVLVTLFNKMRYPQS